MLERDEALQEYIMAVGIAKRLITKLLSIDEEREPHKAAEIADKLAQAVQVITINAHYLAEYPPDTLTADNQDAWATLRKVSFGK